MSCVGVAIYEGVQWIASFWNDCLAALSAFYRVPFRHPLEKHEFLKFTPKLEDAFHREKSWPFIHRHASQLDRKHHQSASKSPRWASYWPIWPQQVNAVQVDLHFHYPSMYGGTPTSRPSQNLARSTSAVSLTTFNKSMRGERDAGEEKEIRLRLSNAL